MMTFYEANKEGKKKNLQRSTVTKNKQNGSKEKKKNQISFKCYNMKYLILEE